MATNKFLDYTGLQYFYENLFKKFPDEADFGDDFIVTKDNNGNITSITLNLGDGFKRTPGTGGAPDIIEVDTGDLFVDMYDTYTVPAGKTDTVNGGKDIIRLDPNYLTFEYTGANETHLRLTVNVEGIGEALATDSIDPTDPTDIPTPGSIYYNISDHKLYYTLPAASTSVRGGVKVGDGLEIASGTDDVLQAKVDGVTLEIDNATKSLKVKDGKFATLDGNGKVPSSQLPSFVDDVIEGYFVPGDPEAVPPTDDAFYGERTGSGTEQDPYVYSDPITGETGKIYVDISNGNTYRWSGSIWVEIGSGSIDIITNNDIDTIMGLNTQEEEEP